MDEMIFSQNKSEFTSEFINYSKFLKKYNKKKYIQKNSQKISNENEVKLE